jgi:hypothetical protein
VARPLHNTTHHLNKYTPLHSIMHHLQQRHHYTARRIIYSKDTPLHSTTHHLQQRHTTTQHDALLTAKTQRDASRQRHTTTQHDASLTANTHHYTTRRITIQHRHSQKRNIFRDVNFLSCLPDWRPLGSWRWRQCSSETSVHLQHKSHHRRRYSSQLSPWEPRILQAHRVH